jgi:hypothetical protein
LNIKHSKDSFIPETLSLPLFSDESNGLVYVVLHSSVKSRIAVKMRSLSSSRRVKEFG